MEYFLGVDIGTTAIKGIILSSTGDVIAKHYVRRTQLQLNRELHPDHPNNIWNAFTSLIKELTSFVPTIAKNLTAMAISGIVPNVCLVGAQETVHQPLLRYSDRRAYDIELTLDQELMNGVWQNEVLSKLIWLKQNTCLDQVADLRLFSPHTWLTYKLSGQYVMDRITAIEHGCIFDLSKQCWNVPILNKFSINNIEFPTVTSPFASVGTIVREVAEELKISDTVQVATGGPDFLASLLGSGVKHKGEVMVYLGTYHCACELSHSLREIHEGHINSHPTKWIATIPQAGPQCETAAELVTGCSGIGMWEQLELLANQETSDYLGSVFVPCIDLVSSTISTTPTSGFFFRGSSRNRNEMAQGIFHGAAAGISLDLERRGFKLTDKKVYVSGGGCRSAYQRQALSDALLIPVTFIPSSEDGLGSALIAVHMFDETMALRLITQLMESVTTSPNSSALSSAASEFYRRLISADLSGLENKSGMDSNG